jgi:hypothetical protein
VNPTLLLAIATLALVVGPLFERLSRRVPLMAALIDGATVGGIVVVSFLHLMPEAGAHLGWWALVLLAVGLVLPMWAERLLARSAGSLRLSVGVLVVGLLLVHEVIESAALASKANEERVGIATLLVVVGHRLPLGLLLWGHTKRRFGKVASIAVLVFVAAFTWFGPVLVPIEAGTFTAGLSALLAGGLLHLVLQHAPESELSREHEASRHAVSALGAVFAIAFFVPYLLTGGGGHGHGHEHAEDVSLLADRLTHLVIESAPYLLAGVLGAACIEAFLPASLAKRFSSGPRWRQALAGVAIGTPMPVCSCGVLPIYRSLIQRGVAPTAALALLVSAPEIGVDSILLSWKMLGPSATVARVGAALVLALCIGYFVGALAERAGARDLGHVHADECPSGALARLRRGLLETWGHLAPWIVIGLVLTAMIEPWIDPHWARATPPWLQIVILCLIGMPTYICATAATPLAAMLLAKGFAPGAVIAFLLTGPATNLTTFGALQRLHSTRVALAFVALAFAVTFALGALVNALAPLAVADATPHEVEHENGPVAQACAVLLGLMTLWVLLRQGPRAFLGQLWSGDGRSTDAHAHGHSHGHAHAPDDAATAREG